MAEPTAADLERARKYHDKWLFNETEQHGAALNDLAHQFAVIRAEATKAERERCAKVAFHYQGSILRAVCERIAAAIREDC